MSVVLRSVSGPLNDITFKNRLSVDRSLSIKSLVSPNLGPGPKSESTLHAPTHETTTATNIVEKKVEPKPCSKRKPLKDITLKICHQLSQSVASCQASPDIPDADFTIYVDTPTTQHSKTKKSVQEPVEEEEVEVAVTLKAERAATDKDTQEKENVAPTTTTSSLTLQAKKDKQIIPQPTASSPKTKKQPSAPSKKTQVDPAVNATMPKRKRRQTMDSSASTKRASLRMMR